MYSTPVKRSDLKKLSKSVQSARKIAITCHVKPDGDAVGSTLALYHVMQQLGKECYVVPPDSIPDYLRFLPGSKEIIPYSGFQETVDKIMSEADMLFCLDFNAVNRVDRLSALLVKSKAMKVLIDHHIGPEKFTDITISSPSDCSTCFLLFKVLCQLGLAQLINKETAICLAAGMMTDTGNFSYNANDPEAYIAMSQLLRCGVDKVEIWERLNVKKENQLRLNGYALSEKMSLLSGNRVSLIQLTREELNRFDYKKGDLEGLVNIPLEIAEVKMSVLMHEEPGFIKVSMRSQGPLPVNEICEKFFNGGGHLNAAGGEFQGTMEEAARQLQEALTLFESDIKERKNDIK